MDCTAQLQSARDTIARYLTETLVGGDYLNDFLSEIPECGAGALQGIGMVLATLLGYPA